MEIRVLILIINISMNTSQIFHHSDSEHLRHEQLLLLSDTDDPDQAPHCDASAPSKSCFLVNSLYKNYYKIFFFKTNTDTHHVVPTSVPASMIQSTVSVRKQSDAITDIL